VNEWPQAATPAWARREEGSQEYDVGRITYGYVPLGPLRQLVPEPRAEDFSIAGVTVPVFSCEHEIHAPLSLVFEVANNLPTRLHWMQGAREVEMLNHDLNRRGTKHRCIVDKNSPVMVTSGSTRAANTITLSETDEKKKMCSVYTFRKESGTQTRLRIDGFVKDDLVWRILFTLLLKKKLTNWFQASGEKLKHYCEELYTTQRM
jgi:hypothetical protein